LHSVASHNLGLASGSLCSVTYGRITKCQAVPSCIVTLASRQSPDQSGNRERRIESNRQNRERRTFLLYSRSLFSLPFLLSS
jgi:hypothetical protein